MKKLRSFFILLIVTLSLTSCGLDFNSFLGDNTSNNNENSNTNDDKDNNSSDESSNNNQTNNSDDDSNNTNDSNEIEEELTTKTLSSYLCSPYDEQKDVSGNVKPYVVESAVSNDGKDLYQVYLGKVVRVPVEIYDSQYFDVPMKNVELAYEKSNYVSNEKIVDEYNYNSVRVHTINSGSKTYMSSSSSESSQKVKASAGLKYKVFDFSVEGENEQKQSYNQSLTIKKDWYSEYDKTKVHSLYTFDKLVTEESNYTSKKYQFEVEKLGYYRYGKFVDCDVYIFVTLSYEDESIVVEDMSTFYSPIEATVTEGITYSSDEDFHKEKSEDFFEITEQFILDLDYTKEKEFETFTPPTEKTETSSFSYSKVDNYVKLTKYKGNDELVNIPTRINGLEVKEISESCFESKTNIKYVKIPATVTKIGYAAFKDCKNLIRVDLSNGLLEIGDNSFSNCFHLRYMLIPDSIEKVGFLSFYNCFRLSYELDGNSLYLGNESNPYLILINAKNKSIERYDINSQTRVIAGGAFMRCDQIESDYLIIPDNIINIGPSTFEGAYLSEIKLSNNMKEISFKSFYSCNSLKNIEIPNSIKFIDIGAFSYCDNIKNVYFDGAVEEWMEMFFYSSPMVNANNLFFRNDEGEVIYKDKNYTMSPSSIIMPDHVEIINDYTFAGFHNMENITISNSVTKIGNNAFYNCSSLTKIIIPNSVTEIGKNAFYNCSSLTEITIPNSVTEIGYGAFRNCTSLTEIILPPKLEVIYESTFYGCTSLKKVTMPNTVKTIWNSAFYNCVNLEEINLSTGLIDIYQSVFNGCTKLSNIIIPDGVTFIGYSTFSNCTSLTNIIIPNSVTKLGECLFLNCSNLETIVLSNAITEIPESLFKNCSKLQGVLIKDGVTTICKSAFANCTNLQSVSIPISLKSIMQGAFSNCTNLVEIEYLGTKSDWNKIKMNANEFDYEKIHIWYE